MRCCGANDGGKSKGQRVRAGKVLLLLDTVGAGETQTRERAPGGDKTGNRTRAHTQNSCGGTLRSLFGEVCCCGMGGAKGAKHTRWARQMGWCKAKFLREGCGRRAKAGERN
jgi:hypothetical protein